MRHNDFWFHAFHVYLEQFEAGEVEGVDGGEFGRGSRYWSIILGVEVERPVVARLDEVEFRDMDAACFGSYGVLETVDVSQAIQGDIGAEGVVDLSLWLEGHDEAAWPHSVGHDDGMCAEVGSHVEGGITRLEDFSEKAGLLFGVFAILGEGLSYIRISWVVEKESVLAFLCDVHGDNRVGSV